MYHRDQRFKFTKSVGITNKPPPNSYKEIYCTNYHSLYASLYNIINQCVIKRINKTIIVCLFYYISDNLLMTKIIFMFIKYTKCRAYHYNNRNFV